MDNFKVPTLEMEMPPALEGPSLHMLAYLHDDQEPDLRAATAAVAGDFPLELLETASENVITLVDSSGREFHTNLRATDLPYLVKYSIISSLRRELRTHKTASKTDALLGRSIYGANGLGQTSTGQAEPSQHLANTDYRTRHEIFDSLKSKQTFDLLDDPVVQNLKYDLNDHDYAPEKAPRKFQRIPKKIKISRIPSPYQPGGTGKTKLYLSSSKRKDNSNKGRRCRKVYGVEQRDKWCNMCKWKKACNRFADALNDDSSESLSPTGASKRLNKYRPTIAGVNVEDSIPLPLQMDLPPPCDYDQAIEALRESV